MQESSTISRIIRDKTDMLPMKKEDCERYERATRCGNCDKLFTPENYKVRHLTGDFLFACCNSCNL